MEWFEELSGGKLLLGEPMARHTTFRIGGRADGIFCPASPEAAASAFRAAARRGERVTVIGNGSNLLVRDGGIRGLTLRFGGDMRAVGREGALLRAQAGASLRRAAEAALACGLSGLEFAAGIPGSVGGAVAMNAGAYGSAMADVVRAVTVVTPQGEIGRVPGAGMEFGYRESVLRRSGAVALACEFALTPGDPSAIRALMEEYAAMRAAKQPLDMPSAGSVFKRPPGMFAGKLIQDAGLMGRSEGGAQVSRKHAGFIVNTGGATAADVLALISVIQEAVLRKFGVSLETEIRVIGEDA